MGLSNAERQHRWRQRRKGRLAELERQLNATSESGPTTKVGRDYSHANNPKVRVAPDATSLALEKELAAARARILDLEDGNAALKGVLAHERKQRAPAKSKVEKPPLPPDEERERIIKGLKTRVRNLMTQLRETERFHKEALAKAGGMPRETRIAIDKVLHPNGNPSAADKDTACKGWNVWKNDNDKARRKGR